MGDDLFGTTEVKKEVKPITFEFKSTKGSSVKVVYKPSDSVKISDKKAFEGHLLKVADMFEVVKAKPKTITEVAKESEVKSE